DVVVVGWDGGLTYAALRRAALLVQRGARLVATNDDATLPAPDGLWPGAGAILAAVVTASGGVPLVVGKPHRTLLEVVAAAAGDGPVLAIGDRLETDVAGAAAMGWDSALVLTGAARREDVAGSGQRPTYVVDSIADLVAVQGEGRRG
ncbi:MAG TPA: HAD hydrolase-like protein, partial [Actinomycetota bacterium]|nr:HAD hydrolase-like protein [Actinomycetota bacterium]